MRFPLLPIILLLVFNGVIDLVIYRIIKRYYHSKAIAKVQAVLSILLALLLIVTICMPKRTGSDGELVSTMWMLYTYVSCYVPKYIFLILHFIAKVPKIWHGRTVKAISMAGAILGIVFFALMWWGALINRYNIQVREVDVPVASLPQAFEGLTIAQISDLHVGSYGTDTTFVSRLVDSVNALKPDIIVFTGDIVNRHSQEFKPFMQTISRLHAPCGVYSIMGNHDYGDYSAWPSPQAKDEDVLHLKAMEESSGLHMLNNATEWIHVNGDSIALIGVENIGDPPFKIYGDLHQAYPTIDDDKIKVLLSHNPAHWEMEIADKSTNVALTLSGHTHAMQMELFGVSPAALRYDKWGGLYHDKQGQYLYVNIGAGTVGMPYRIGANPEITLLKLVRN